MKKAIITNEFDASKISDSSYTSVATTLLHLIIKHYEDPKNQAAFEEWKKEREESGKSR